MDATTIARLKDHLTNEDCVCDYEAEVGRLLAERQVLLDVLKRLDQYHGGEWTSLERKLTDESIAKAEAP